MGGWSSSGSLAGISLKDAICFPVVEPVAELAARGKWTDLLAMGRWNACRRELPAAVRAHVSPAGHDRIEAVDLDPCQLRATADRLLHWSTDILTCAHDAAADDVRDVLASSIRWLRSAALGLEVGSEQATSAGAGAYTARHMLRAMMLSRHVCDTKSLKSVVLHAVSLAYPSLVKHAEAMIHEAGYRGAPSASSISRCRVSFDAALLLMEHDPKGRAGRGVLRYGMADSSPQKGHDWLLSCFDEIPVDKMVGVYRAVLVLIGRR